MVKYINCINSQLFAVAALIVWMNNASADVFFSGFSPDQEANARAVVPLASANCDSARWRIQQLFGDADKDLHNALEALGYYELSVTKSLSWDDLCWHATFEIVVGDPVRLRQVEVFIKGEAMHDPAIQSRVATNPLVPG